MSSRLFIESLPPLEELESRATEQDLLQISGYTSSQRRAESLAWRAIVRRELGDGVSISYDEWGGPIVTNPHRYIGVSHTTGYVAVAISESPCAVDIEGTQRNFDRVVSRYLTPQEQQLSSHPLYRAVAWSAKETLYKYYRRRELDILQDIRILEADIEGRTLRGQVANGESLSMKVEFLDGNVVVSIM